MKWKFYNKSMIWAWSNLPQYQDMRGGTSDLIWVIPSSRLLICPGFCAASWRWRLLLHFYFGFFMPDLLFLSSVSMDSRLPNTAHALKWFRMTGEINSWQDVCCIDIFCYRANSQEGLNCGVPEYHITMMLLPLTKLMQCLLVWNRLLWIIVIVDEYRVLFAGNV